MKNLQRFFKIGIYYPPDHHMAAKSSIAVLKLLKTIVGREENYIHFSATEKSLNLQGLDLDQELFSVRYLHDLLFNLSITVLKLHRDINGEELRQLFSRLIFLQAEVQSSKIFQEIKIQDLPPTVKIHQLKFLTSQTATGKGSDDNSQPTIDYLLSSLVEQGLDDRQIAACRHMLESIPAILKGRQLNESDLPSVGWDDVQILLQRVAESLSSPETDAPLPEHHHNIDALVAILKSIEGQSKGRESRKAINLLINVAKGKKEYSDTPLLPTSKEDNCGPSYSIEDLNAALVNLKNKPIPKLLSENNRSGELSILMQMLGQDHHIQVTIRMQELLQRCLRAPLTEREWQVIVRGVRHIIQHLKPARAEVALKMLLEILHRNEYIKPLQFIYAVCQGLNQTEFATIWPFLVNEAFFVDPKEEPELFQEVCPVIGLLPQGDMHHNLPRLERMEALTTNLVPVTIFSPPHPSLIPLILLLLNSTHAAYIYSQLLYGLRRHSLGWLDQAVTPLLDATVPADQAFLHDILQQASWSEPSKTLRRHGTKIIMERLPDLAQEDRLASWVPNTIKALSQTHLKGRHLLLESIAMTKQYKFISEWPATARQAANTVLNEIF